MPKGGRREARLLLERLLRKVNGGAGKTTSSFQDREFYGFYNWSEAKKAKLFKNTFNPNYSQKC